MTDIENSGGTGPRLFVDQQLAQDAVIMLPPQQAHYLASVMRMRPGDAVRLFDNITGEWAARVLEVGRRSVVAAVESRLSPREEVPDLWLCAAPIKRGRIDWVAEKACELGVARLQPVVTHRTVVDKLNLERLRAHMVEAAEQCGRTALPELAEPVALGTLLDNWNTDRCLIFCDEEGGAPLLDAVPPGPAAILVGPEGGFDVQERNRLRSHPAAIRVALGRRVLRADTAAVAAVALWQAAAGDWR